jgi:hypothetical protein
MAPLRSAAASNGPYLGRRAPARASAKSPSWRHDGPSYAGEQLDVVASTERDDTRVERDKVATLDRRRFAVGRLAGGPFLALLP